MSETHSRANCNSNNLDNKKSYKNVPSEGAGSKLQNLGVLQHPQAPTCLWPCTSVDSRLPSLIHIGGSLRAQLPVKQT